MRAKWQLDDPTDPDQGERFVAGPVQVTLFQFSDEEVMTVETFTTVEFSSFGDLIPDEILSDPAKTKVYIVEHLTEQAKAMNAALGLEMKTPQEEAVLEAAKKWVATFERGISMHSLELVAAVRAWQEGK